MKVYEKKVKCCGCEACVSICPTRAITMKEDKEGFFYPRVEQKKCIHCGACKRVCQAERTKSGAEPRAYIGAQALDDEIRYQSSSGGMFYLLAEHVLLQGGAVCAAAMTDAGRVEHLLVDSSEWRQCGNRLRRLQKTKYVQSRMGDCYSRIKGLLEKEQWVLFTGTPCQCEGVKQYLSQCLTGTDKLILAALICYGAPSPGVWERYVAVLEKTCHGKLQSFSFRDKRSGDNGHTVAYVIDDKEYTMPLNQNPFCRLYFQNRIIRPACHKCSFCTPDRAFDFTLGDFWGIEKVKPDFDDGMGNSLVLLHSEKAVEIWEQIKKKTRHFHCERKDVLQPRLCEPTKAAVRRGWLWGRI